MGLLPEFTSREVAEWVPIQDLAPEGVEAWATNGVSS